MVTVREVFRGAGLEPMSGVRWRSRVELDEPGVYLVATTDDADDPSGMDAAGISDDAVGELMIARPELSLDGLRPTIADLSARLASMWLPGEPAVYIGLAGTSVRNRVAQFYRTPLGARRPHAGGWPIKTLSAMDELTVFVAACPDPAISEHAMLAAFAAGVEVPVPISVCDRGRLMPFANLEYPKGTRKRHGIRGSREPRRRLP